jgi:mRNA-degrading endonuclease RelE of RelBE toxin-antitoxin system
MKIIRFTKEAESEFKSLDVFIRTRIKSTLKKIAKGVEEGVPLMDKLTGNYKIVVGKYRALYFYKSDRMVVWKVGKRSEIDYEEL